MKLLNGSSLKEHQDWCWSWISNTWATSCEEPTHWKSPWCWEGLGAGGEGNDRGWDSWMASVTRWAWVWATSGSWWWTGRPGVLQFTGSQRVGHDWATELNWTRRLRICLQCRRPEFKPRVRKIPWRSEWQPLQYSCLENPMNRGAWKTAVHGVAEGRTRLSDFTFTFHFDALEEEMAIHPSVLAWRIPGTGGTWWAAVYGVAQSWTRLKWLSSSSRLLQEANINPFEMTQSSTQVSKNFQNKRKSQRI